MEDNAGDEAMSIQTFCKNGRLVVCVASALLLVSCASARRGEPVAGPMRIESEKVARGEKVFMTHCHKCHPGGETGVGFAINNKPLPGPLIKAQVRAGIGAMPAFPKELISKRK